MKQVDDFNAGVSPEDAFLDSSRPSGFSQDAFDGRIVRALSSNEVRVVGILFVIVLLIFGYKLLSLQILHGEQFATASIENTLERSVLFAQRGTITDRSGTVLAWNTSQLNDKGEPKTDTYALRRYTELPGMAHVLGYVNYPEYDAHGRLWRDHFVAQSGVEASFDELLSGVNGYMLVEHSATGEELTRAKIQRAVSGESVTLSIDAELSAELYRALQAGAERSGFVGGAGVIMDVETGEVLALSNFPEIDVNVLTQGDEHETIVAYHHDERKPFLNRVVQGTYTPGSIIKPYIGAVALDEGVISSTKQLLSTGELRVPNPYYPGQYTSFRDWTDTLGWLDMREAIKMSSSIYFYIIGGGFEDQTGLGIAKIKSWAEQFGFGEQTGIPLGGEQAGLVPSPGWQKEVFGEESVWTLGNTYHSSIGQYGWLVTPIQAVRYIASLANGGTLLTPLLVKGAQGDAHSVSIGADALQVVKEGMRASAQSGTAKALNIDGIHIAAKTGTAQLGARNEHMNSWVVGFWPYEEPRFAFAVVLEKAPAETLYGAAPTMNSFFTWLVREHGADYARGEYPSETVGNP